MFELFKTDSTMIKKYNKLIDEKNFLEEDSSFDHI
jgi:hypothetical protein